MAKQRQAKSDNKPVRERRTPRLSSGPTSPRCLPPALAEYLLPPFQPSKAHAQSALTQVACISTTDDVRMPYALNCATAVKLLAKAVKSIASASPRHRPSGWARPTPSRRTSSAALLLQDRARRDTVPFSG